MPPIIEFSGKDLVTTDPKPTITLDPNSTPFRIVQFAPIQQFEPIFTLLVDIPIELLFLSEWSF